ncbi:ABC transporter ATP-binding protein [Halalkalibacterium halodurans]|jgi:putative hydroxymethylpyrimidine transport system ATP-binding protein|uniref:ABC transporter ATP-binding protein n=1 Tax=Halalkalibacterium halodurans TaxID=86665 RepID=A0A0M0KIC2_ALKHA|nr:ABC transporter ATP-binding protein [Halalkalibacterium halodurans]MED3646278.1 ABC transporter ATP-binding protein [Halalkalibacterium halodurans]MED4163164.1 ABC transporter ATP-binding protein [Halalkalibacterium halodurans]TPE69449.1 ABC transporter ATP-binding protein [Halalkalibacterium halodurans]
MVKELLTFEEVSFAYSSSSPVIERLSFTVFENEIVAILAKSGSGKSTLFRLITGLESPDQGTIVCHAQGKIGYMPQQDLLLPWLTILENVSLPLEIQGKDKKEAKIIAASFFNRFGLVGTESLYPDALSGGMRQRAAFLRATLTSETLLLLDEPFASLDSLTKTSMHRWLVSMWEKEKRTLLLVTHDIEEALLLSDRLFIFTNQPLHGFTEVQVPPDLRRKMETTEEMEQHRSSLKKDIRALLIEESLR